MYRMRTRIFRLALLVSSPMALLALRSCQQGAAQLFDPCLQRAATSGALPNSYSMQAEIGTGGPCRSHIEVTTETREHAIARLLIVPGGILLAVALMAAGAARLKSNLMIAASLLMCLESIPLLFSFSPLALATSGAFVVLARSAAPIRGRIKIFTILLGMFAAILAAIAGATASIAVRTAPGNSAGLVIPLSQMIPALFVSVAAWWPSGRN